MADIRKVVLYGNSLFMAGVEASLKRKDGLDVQRIDATLPGARQRLDALRPAAVVFDLADPPLGFVLPFLREHLDLPLVGLDVTSNTVLVLSCRQYTALTVNDLAQVIQIQLSTSARGVGINDPECALEGDDPK
jgi:hypothetical protein